jgi:hypothetical protein
MSQVGTYLVDNIGQIVKVPDDQVSEALHQGWTPATEEQADKYDLQAKYGTTSQAAIGGLESAASALTFGGSTVLERALGVNAEDIKGREKANPVAHLVGTGVGALAPIVLSGGTGLLGSAARVAPASLALRAGEAVTGAVEGAIGTGTSLGSKIAARAAAQGLGRAVEFGAYGAGEVVHESAIGDPSEVAQSALSTIGMAALFGGALGAVGGAAAGALSGVTKGLPESQIGTKLASWLGEVEGNRNLKAAGAIQGDISRSAKQISRKELNKIGQEMGDLGLVDAFSTPEKTLERAGELLKKTGQEIGGILQAADEAAVMVEGATPKIDDVLRRAQKEILEPLAGNPLQNTAKNNISEMLEAYGEKFKDKLNLQDLHDMRRQVSDAIYGWRGNQDPFANAMRESLHDFRNILSDEIEQGLKRANASTEAWKKANRIYQVASKAEEFAERGVDRGLGNNLISLTETIGAVGGGITGGAPGAILSGLATAAVRRHGSGVLGALAGATRRALEAGVAPETLSALAQLERAQQSTANRIDSLTLAIINRSSKAMEVGRSEVAAGVAKSFSRNIEDSTAQYTKRVDELNRLADHGQMLATLEQSTADMFEHAPAVAQAIQVATMRGVSFLATKVPRPPQRGPLASEWVPNRAEVAKFNRYYEAVNKPETILKQAAAGTLSPEAVEAVKTVYPQLYSKMVKQLLLKLSTRTEGLSYLSKSMISMLLGQDMDGTRTPSMILSNQQAMGSGAQQQQPQGGPGPHKLSAITVSNRNLTASQASAQRKP